MECASVCRNARMLGYISSQDPDSLCFLPCHSWPYTRDLHTSIIMVQFNSEVVAAAAAALNFTQVALTPPLNWIAGNSLFPSQIIAGYNAEVSEYTAEEWSAHILEACQGFSACTSADGFQGKCITNYFGTLSDLLEFTWADSQYQQQTVVARAGDIGLDTCIEAVPRTSHSMFERRE